jgi:hypothetical protein
MHRVERLASLPAIGYPLLLAWQKGWLPPRRGLPARGGKMAARRRVIACEPYPANAIALRENLRINETDWAHDVEGWEARVLQGATQTLRRTANVLIEINRPALKKSGSAPEEILQLLKSGLRRFAPPSEITNVLAGKDVRS